MDALLPDDPRWVGPYRLDGRLGAGGMGQVYAGTSPGGRKVAVKLIRPELADTPQFRARFQREVDAARQVGGFHTAQVVDADPDAASPWLVTAFIPGPTLHEVVRERGPLAPEAVLRLGAGLAEGLAAIHRCGLVHRDLKPGNVILADDGPRIIDFGIARAVDASSLTATGAVIGTYAYMSPEQIRADRAGPASDVFALGSVLGFAATGHSPFDAPTLLAVVQRILDDPPALDGLDGELRRLLTTCLAKDPAQRPPVAGLPERFAGAADGGTAGPPTPAAQPERTVVLTPGERTTPLPPAERPRPATMVDPGAGATPAAPPRPDAPSVDPHAATRPGPARPEAPGGPVTPADPVPEPAGGRKVSRRALLIGGLSVVTTAAAVAVPVVLLDDSGSPLTPGPDGVTLGDRSSVYGLTYGPDGRTLLVATGDGTIWRWDLAAESNTTARIGGPKYVQPHVFTRDRKTLFRADENRILAWDVASGRTTGTFTGVTNYRLQEGFVSSLDVSPDGRTLAASTPQGLFLWDVPSGRRLALHDDVKNGPAAFGPDGKVLATGSPVQLRQMPEDRTLLTVGGSEGGSGAVFSPDGQLLAVSSRATVLLWNTASRQEVTTLKTDDLVQALAFHPGGRILAGGDMGGKVTLWDTTSGNVTTTFDTHSDVTALAFSPDGKAVAVGLGRGAGSGDRGTIRIWPVP
ncbi:WD40 repeat domain-containing serine/threonine protein kinase [Streptomyces sp. UNOB3_S3]|uniref:WD40 repeat domain-containing serine/threonine protein kinase n=1 Tax=Streptomyces sp. UNOB3_S3 TaxID=2871682 RepID=UPI001E4066C4|nr:serine/threonine-protein kinase [Streptomyces sp. UNOB3_S3]MCC3776870.1 protein kinase [Streptomyces sp. UNOB3_S3]